LDTHSKFCADEGEIIEAMDKEDTDKYLGFVQEGQTEHTKIKLLLTDEFHRRLHNVPQKKK
jgi:hypothetical protein